MLYTIITWTIVFCYYGQFRNDIYNEHSKEYWVLLLISMLLFSIGRELEKTRKELKNES